MFVEILNPCFVNPLAVFLNQGGPGYVFATFLHCIVSTLVCSNTAVQSKARHRALLPNDGVALALRECRSRYVYRKVLESFSDFFLLFLNHIFGRLLLWVWTFCEPDILHFAAAFAGTNTPSVRTLPCNPSAETSLQPLIFGALKAYPPKSPPPLEESSFHTHTCTPLRHLSGAYPRVGIPRSQTITGAAIEASAPPPLSRCYIYIYIYICIHI